MECGHYQYSEWSELKTAKFLIHLQQKIGAYRIPWAVLELSRPFLWDNMEVNTTDWRLISVKYLYIINKPFPDLP